MDEKLKAVEARMQVLQNIEADRANAMDQLDDAQKALDAAVADLKVKAPEGSYWHRQAEWSW